jgi:hypothetical protein
MVVSMKSIPMNTINTDLMNEFYLLQASRSNEKYLELLDDHVYSPIQRANTYVSALVRKRGDMLMHMDARVNRTLRRFKKRYLKF